MLVDRGGGPSRSVLWTTDALRFGLAHPITSSYNLRGPVPEPGDLRRAGLSQSWPEPVPHRFLREYPPGELARQNGQLAGPRSVGRCADRREIPCTEGANAAELGRWVLTLKV
ncbi:hypothetical protein THAOC_15895 [Thalassiosira oceanica]|uniref:Uncharacterized protein n=1 Tax=Thalassiosira oceanica TaxID=159749 RepID=K0SQU6_THAOC|nr:hypothetical protein THAOC_15895 [Thalassiosira oceanica]|eukprot:EJK63441.1 hypothetical protein THAOC_15895 [Thalassiosira oceanica]